MEGVTKGLDKAMSNMDLEKVSQIMEKFESQFEDLDVHSRVRSLSSSSMILCKLNIFRLSRSL